MMEVVVEEEELTALEPHLTEEVVVVVPVQGQLEELILRRAFEMLAEEAAFCQSVEEEALILLKVLSFVGCSLLLVEEREDHVRGWLAQHHLVVWERQEV